MGYNKTSRQHSSSMCATFFCVIYKIRVTTKTALYSVSPKHCLFLLNPTILDSAGQHPVIIFRSDRYCKETVKTRGGGVFNLENIRCQGSVKNCSVNIETFTIVSPFIFAQGIFKYTSDCRVQTSPS